MPFIELQSINSTNNYARRLINAGLAQVGTAIFAHEQWGGKGQRGKTWQSEKGANILLTLLVKPVNLRIDQQFSLSACTAVSIHRFFSKYSRNNCSIKWPNDLYWQDRKAGGILIENVIRAKDSEPDWQWSVVGIGLNINQARFPTELINPVSLKQITGINHDVLELARELQSTCERNYADLFLNGPEKYFNEYERNLYKKDRLVSFRQDNRVFNATIKGITPEGKLVVQHAIEEQFNVGGVEMVSEDQSR